MLEHQRSEKIIGKSQKFMKVLDLAAKVARSSASVLITGESGTGKEVIARVIHKLSPRSNQAFIALNCSAIPENLIESELFGYARGAFTGAHTSKAGLFEEAEQGTLFLDEIGDLDLHLQAKLLRVIQERKIKRVGENHYRPIDIRILAATHNNLQDKVNNQKFREDLFFRLNVVSLKVPPLRERREDILPLAEFFLRKYSLKYDTPLRQLSPESQEILVRRSWKGNVRELENIIERVTVLSAQTVVFPSDLQINEEESGDSLESVFMDLYQRQEKFLSLEELNQAYINFVLKVNDGAREKSSRDLGIDRKTLYRKTKTMFQ